MSEEATSSASTSETVESEPTAPTAKAPRKKLWVMIAAVAVVAILIGSSLYVMFLAPMKASMTPDDVTIDAGQTMMLNASVKKGIKSLTDSSDVKYRWRLNPDTLASFDFKSRPQVNLTAGIVAGAGTLSCEITYKSESVVLSKPVTVKPPFLEQVLVTPSVKTLEKGTTKVFAASAIDSVGNPIANLTYTWAVAGAVTATLNATTGSSVNLTAGSVYGNVTLSATTSWQGASKTGNSQVIIGPLPPRKIDYRWYDMFNIPFGDWWGTRWSYYKTEQVITNSYPYMFNFYATPEGNVRVYANARLNVTARNVTQINMNDNPEFLPLHGFSRGGTAVIDWYMQYLSKAEIIAAGISSGNDDGWVIGLNGTVTLDKQAALSVIKGLSAANYDMFSSWWGSHGTDVSNDIMGWIANEAGKDRLNIYPAYDGTFQMMAGTVAGQKVGDKVVLTYNLVTWGMEAVLMRWLREAFMPTEWWFEDTNFHAVIGPELSNLDIDTAVEYAMYAFETTDSTEIPCWIFEGMLQDVDPSAPPDVPHSDIDPYLDFDYRNYAVGNKYYGQMMGYDYTPGAWNLSTNETLTLTWPSGQQTFLVHVPVPGQPFDTTAPLLDSMKVLYSEPMGYDSAQIAPGTLQIDNTNNKVVFTGPIDMWDWSKNQTTHTGLEQNWTRIGLLPHGAPWIEFQPEHGVVRWAKTYSVSDLPAMPVNNTPASFNVTVKDNYGNPYREFDGTIHFSSNRTDVDLPADYTFDAGVDAGKHQFQDEITFRGLGEYNITMTTVSGNTTGYYTDIWVIPDPEVIDHFTLEVSGVRGIVVKGLATDVRVTAYNQYPAPHDVFRGYSGTIVFETNATPGTYTLPPNTPFTAANKGVLVAHGLLFDEKGQYDLNVSDQATPGARGTTNVVVSIPPEINYRLYDMFEQPWGDWWPWRLTTYKTDVLLNSKPHEYTMVYNGDSRNLQGLIYAPYRWNTTAKNLTTLSVHSPEFMPILGNGTIAGAEVDMHISWEYLDNASWNGYWKPTWGTNWNWSVAFDNMMPASGMSGQFSDGYYIGVLYTVSLNREAALEWLDLPISADPAAWWLTNRSSYMGEWQRWIVHEGNYRLDIWPSYEAAYSDLGTMMDMVVEPSGKITLKIAHFSWGYEALTNRWINETAICRNFPYYEDFNLSAHYAEEYANVTFDAVAQYSMKAVKANASERDPAWVWEPQRMDYVYYSNPITGYNSEYNPWDVMMYNSWNAGDGYFNTSVRYDNTPTWFNLTNYMILTIQLPTRNDVIGYMGEGLATGRTTGAIYELRRGNASAYENITVHGPMWLGYNMTGTGPGAENLFEHYNNVTKTLRLEGPMDFDNYHYPNGLLYHSAPWIEFNVANLTWGPTVVSAASVDGPAAEASLTSDAVVSEFCVLAMVLSGAIMAVAAVASNIDRRD